MILTFKRKQKKKKCSVCGKIRNTALKKIWPSIYVLIEKIKDGKGTTVSVQPPKNVFYVLPSVSFSSISGNDKISSVLLFQC